MILNKETFPVFEHNWNGETERVGFLKRDFLRSFGKKERFFEANFLKN